MKLICIQPWSSLPIDSKDDVDPFADGFHVRMAKQLKKRTNKYQFECWRPEWKLKKPILTKRDGIVYRAFPSFRPSLGFLNKFIQNGATMASPHFRYSFLREYSPSLIRELRKVAKQDKTIVQLYGFGDLGYLICLFKSNSPITGFHAGAAPFSSSTSTMVSHFPVSLFENKALSKIDILVASTRKYYDYFYGKFKDVRFFQPMGVDFDFFKPSSKEEAKRKLGITPETKVLLHVGRLDIGKGVDNIIEIFHRLKDKYKIELLLVGGLKSDPLYNIAVDSGARVYERMDQSHMPGFYNASDVYLFTRFYKNSKEAWTEEFMGMGAATMEAMSCNVPTVGTNLIHFIGTHAERIEVGRIPKNLNEAIEYTSNILENPSHFSRIREIACSYYSWDVIADNFFGVYDELSKRYWGRFYHAY